MQTIQPFIIIADFETYTNNINQIKPYSFPMFTHCIFDVNLNELTCYTGKNCLDNFFNHLKLHINWINKIKNKPNLYSNPTVCKNNTDKPICSVCNKVILTDKPLALWYYCKKTGYLYGFKHGECKGRKNQLTVLFHNGAKFDFRLKITYLEEKCFDSNISCISNSMGTFLTFSINNFDNTIITLRFIDSYKHLSSSLDAIVKSLLKKDTDINSIKNKPSFFFQYFDDKALKLLRKGVYPCDCMDENWKNKLKEKELPDIKYFHSSVANTKCSSSDYNYAKETFNYFEYKNAKYYKWPIC